MLLSDLCVCVDALVWPAETGVLIGYWLFFPLRALTVHFSVVNLHCVFIIFILMKMRRFIMNLIKH